MSHSFSFTARLPIATTRPPLREADVTLLVDGDGRLSVIWLPHIRNWLGPPRTPGRSTLLEGVRELDIAYWHQDQEATGSWVDVWTGPGVPRLVRLRIPTKPAGYSRAKSAMHSNLMAAMHSNLMAATLPI